MAVPKGLAIGDVAARTGLSVSAIRFYEGRGLVHPERSSGGQRVFLRSDIRRLSFILIAQQIGLTIEEISQLLSSLPERRPSGTGPGSVRPSGTCWMNGSR